jgi:hypothetical protein
MKGKNVKKGSSFKNNDNENVMKLFDESKQLREIVREMKFNEHVLRLKGEMNMSEREWNVSLFGEDKPVDLEMKFHKVLQHKVSSML